MSKVTSGASVLPGYQDNQKGLSLPQPMLFLTNQTVIVLHNDISVRLEARTLLASYTQK